MLYGFAIQPVRLHRLKTSQGMVNMTSMRTTLHNIGSPCMLAAINHWLAGLRIFTMYIHVFCSFATKDLAKSTTCCQMYDWTRCQGRNMMQCRLPVPRMGWWRMMNLRSLFRLSDQVVRWMPWHCMSICELIVIRLSGRGFGMFTLPRCATWGLSAIMLWLVRMVGLSLWGEWARLCCKEGIWIITWGMLGTVSQVGYRGSTWGHAWWCNDAAMRS